METPATTISGIQSPSKKDSPMSKAEFVDIGEVALKRRAPFKSDETELSAAIEQAVNLRRISPRQIQLTAMAGSIGAALFAGIGSGVMSGPLCLFLAFIFWASVVLSVAQCQTEIVTLLPLDGAFIPLAGRMADPALGVAFAQTSYVIFEATVINTLVQYWGYNQSPAIVISSSSSAKVLNWILDSLLYCCYHVQLDRHLFTWIRFNAAIKAQGIDKKSFLPSVSRFQPYAGYWAFFWAFSFLWLQGYAVFIKGNWEVSTFIFNYGIIALASVIGIGRKVLKRTPFHKSEDVDLVSGLEFFNALTEYYRHEWEAAPLTVKDTIMARIFEFLAF
ncbi:uncharacterized protein BDW70DRAFT_156907 [Aspergillus foveolatus]|uniref:uncharacterized protein n=1 Tax=Aspergillus foveolatus TaxID=210207 RepID=UPI003CCD9CE9